LDGRSAWNLDSLGNFMNFTSGTSLLELHSWNLTWEPELDLEPEARRWEHTAKQNRKRGTHQHTSRPSPARARKPLINMLVRHGAGISTGLPTAVHAGHVHVYSRVGNGLKANLCVSFLLWYQNH